MLRFFIKCSIYLDAMLEQSKAHGFRVHLLVILCLRIISFSIFQDESPVTTTIYLIEVVEEHLVNAGELSIYFLRISCTYWTVSCNFNTMYICVVFVCAVCSVHNLILFYCILIPEWVGTCAMSIFSPSASIKPCIRQFQAINSLTVPLWIPASKSEDSQCNVTGKE